MNFFSEVRNKSEKLDSGQAIVEFIAFVPFLLIFYTLFTNISGSINGAINQQKITRGYYYKIDKGNSYFPSKQHLNRVGIREFSKAEYFAVGWMEELQDNRPKATCYKIQQFINAPVDTCDEPADVAQAKTQFVKPYTVYGICGVSFTKNDGLFRHSWENATGCSTAE
jgi:hypothetical protein